MEKIKMTFMPNTPFVNEDGTFDIEQAKKLSGLFAGECYNEEGFEKLKNEPLEKTQKRIKDAIENTHHSVCGHIDLTMEIIGIPKILAMVINNEKEYNTSEKSARYTKVIVEEGSIITPREEELYNKWLDIFFKKIKERYGEIFKDGKIGKLAQENARYLVTSFMPTKMIYKTSFRQYNYLAAFMLDFMKNAKTDFEKKLSIYMQEFIEELDRLKILEPGLMQNEKQRKLSLFGKDLEQKEIHFGETYSTRYKGSIAELAQAQRHRTLYYSMEFLPDMEYFIPPIIRESSELSEMWLHDIASVSDLTPQGQLINIYEMGNYEKFIEKCKERLCSAAQLEIMLQTRETLLKYKEALDKSGYYLKDDIEKYMHGARCTFPDFTGCKKDCHFTEGKLLKRQI